MSEIFQLFVRVMRKPWLLSSSLVGKIFLRLAGAEAPWNLVLYGRPRVSTVKGSRLKIGQRVTLCSWSSFTALGVNHPVVLRTLRADAELILGDDVGMSGGSICAALRVAIGNRTLLGANVTIVDTDFHPLAPRNRRFATIEEASCAEVVIGENVFVGTGSIILKGVHIGENSVIGAGSVVVSDIPKNSIAAGNPCRVLKTIVEEKKE